jgi:hypothetical protein
MTSKSVGHASDLYSFSAIPTGNRAFPSDKEGDPSGNPRKKPENLRHQTPVDHAKACSSKHLDGFREVVG